MNPSRAPSRGRRSLAQGVAVLNTRELLADDDAETQAAEYLRAVLVAHLTANRECGLACVCMPCLWPVSMSDCVCVCALLCIACLLRLCCLGPPPQLCFSLVLFLWVRITPFPCPLHDLTNPLSLPNTLSAWGHLVVAGTGETYDAYLARMALPDSWGGARTRRGARRRRQVGAGTAAVQREDH
jgi:hypothetical protein